MSTNPPNTQSPQTPRQDPPALSESEAMRRMQDLLTAGKFSTSDNVVFEYNQYSFTAQIRPDGSLESRAQQHSTQPINNATLPFKLYASPSEFASDMAARAVLLDEKATRPRGKISINGWSNCTVKGRSLATIRNEMLHERKHENANVSKEKVKDPPGTSVTSTPWEPGSMESPASARCPTGHTTACHNPPTDSQAQSDPTKPRNPISPAPEIEKDQVPTSGEENAADKPTHSDLSGERNTLRKPLGEADRDSASPSHQKHDQEMTPSGAEKDTEQRMDSTQDGSSVHGKLPLNERSFKKMSAEKRREQADTLEIADSGDDLRAFSRRTPKVSAGQKDLDSKEQSDTNTFESAGKKPEGTGSPSHLEPAEREVNIRKEDMTMMKEEKMSSDDKECIDVEMTAILPSDKPSQREARDTRKHSSTSSQGEEARDQGDNRYDNVALPRTQKDSYDGEKDATEMSDDNNRMEQERLQPEEPVECKERTPRDHISPQPASSRLRSLKEVSDLQQEILGDSDSDEESIMEHERKSVSLLKKRSRSPPIHANRKRTRTGECGSAETEGRTATEGPHQKGSTEGSVHGPGVRTTAETEIEGTQLDPETMEAAAIAAQIEKEEASNRARRTTRLATGKIKQVDYKASAVAQPPRSISPGHESEENGRNLNDNESPIETTRTTRRRVTPNQLYPPQRSSRRVAKLRSGQEKDHSSNDEIDNPPARSSSGGNGSEYRIDKEPSQFEDTEVVKGQGSRQNGANADANDRRRGRIDTSVKRTRHAYHEEGDHDSQGRAYSTRASTRENSVVDAAEITDLGDPTDFLSESEDVEDEEDIEDRSNGHGFTTADLTCIAEAVKACGSADPTDILQALREQDTWKTEDFRNQKVEAFLHEISDSLQNLSKSLCLTPEDVNPEQILSFLSAEVWRLSTGGLITGIPRKPTAVLKRATREDQMRSTHERSRRKEHRDVEEMRGSLEKEMEARRRAELDTLFVEINVSEVTRALSREKARCYRVDQETEKYRDMEADIRKRLEKAKVLVGQLRGEKDDSEGANGNVKRELHQDDMLGIEPRPNGSFATSPVLATRNSTTSDDDIEMTDKNITTTSQRLLEMDRLRVLIASREAEAEEFQRICEKERMRFVSTLELKNRLETEIYLYRSHVSMTYGAGNASVVPSSGRIGKEIVKKNDHRGHSSYGNRGPTYMKQKSGLGKNVGSGPAATGLKNIASNSKPKPGPGKISEAPKPPKRKPTVKNGGNGSDKV